MALPSPKTGKTGSRRITGTIDCSNPSPGPNINEGRKIVQRRPEARTSSSAANLVRWYAVGAFGRAPSADI